VFPELSARSYAGCLVVCHPVSWRGVDGLDESYEEKNDALEA
jgi:hypothetical protein